MTDYFNEFGYCDILKYPYSNHRKITSINVKGKKYDIYQDVISKKYIAVIVY